VEPNKVNGEMTRFFDTIRRVFSYEDDAMPTRGVEPSPFSIAYTPSQISHLLDVGAAQTDDD
jgi:hypothetical protein